MDAITIPVDVRLVTLTVTTHRIVQKTIQVGRTTETRPQRVTDVQRIAPGQDKAGAQRDLHRVNDIFKAVKITFRLNKFSEVEVEAPERKGASGQAADRGALDRPGLNTLLALYKGQMASSVLYVDRFAEASLGGVTGWRLDGSGTRTPLFSSVVRRLSKNLSGDTLAHELGHQLGLPDIMPAGSQGHDGQMPLVENRAAGLDSSNLMWGGLRSDSRLTSAQVSQARGSELVRKFGVQPATP